MMSIAPKGNLPAAECLMALHDPDASAEDIQRALDWLEKSEDNSNAILPLRQFWDACDGITEADAAIDPCADEGEAPPWGGRRQFFAAAAGIAAAAVLAPLVVRKASWFGAAPDQGTTVRYASAIGKNRLLRFSDRSSIVLGAGTAVTVTEQKDYRRILLNNGEALFKLGQDSGIRHIVDTGAGLMDADGVIVNANRSALGTTVTMVRGGTSLNIVAGGRSENVRLRTGMQLTYYASGEIDPVAWVDASQVTAWQEGTLHFVARPLALVVADLNRYSERPIIIEDPKLGQEEISGTVRPSSIVEFLKGLAYITDLKVDIAEDGSVILSYSGKSRNNDRHSITDV